MDLERGLSEQEAKKRLKEHGSNELPEKKPPSNFFILLSQLKSPLVYVLLVAGIVTVVLEDYTDAVVIFLAVFINTVLGFFQERKASRALYVLKKLLNPVANVIRSGELVKVNASEVVPGDIVVVSQGDRISADGKLLEANRLYVDESVLTGESSPASKKEKADVFMGTVVTAGRGVFEVTKTGASTQMGGIAASVQKEYEDTPLKQQIVMLSKKLVILVVFLSLFVFVLGYVLRNMSFEEVFATSVALAVSAIPEGLLVGLTVVLAIGMQRILKRKGLVRRLVSAETLGGVTTICVDKTGTLTEGKMKVVDVVGSEIDLVKQSILANDLDDPLVVAAWEWARRNAQGDADGQTLDGLKKKHKRLDSIPFSPKDRVFVSLNKWDNKNNMMFVNGAPEFILEWTGLDRHQKQEILEKIEDLTSQGRRLVGFARKKVAKNKRKTSLDDAKENLEWIGILAFSDPVRQGVAQALTKTSQAGVRTLVITGDYPETAVFVMKELGMNIDEESVITGSRLAKISEFGLAQILKDATFTLFARTTPDQKLKIVEALKKNGEVVAMTGDGVNDAPALKRADIGIVVGNATDVARESADLVLLDSNFATIVASIEEGRGIFDNLRKIILYLMSDAFSEIIAVIGAMILFLPLPVTAVQILWINLVSDGLPDLALTVDPKRRGIMRDKPRGPSEPLVSRWMMALIIIVSLFSGLSALFLFWVVLTLTGDQILARSTAFVTLGVNSLVYVFSVRTLTQPFWEEGLFDNRWLLGAVLIGFLMQILPFAFPQMRDFFGVTILPLVYWVVVLGASVLMFIMIEATKYLFRHKLVKW